MRLLNWRFLDDEPWTRSGDEAHPHAERQRPARTGSVPRWKAENHRAVEILDQLANGVARGESRVRLVAAAHLAEDESAGAGEQAGEPELRQHAIETIRP